MLTGRPIDVVLRELPHREVTGTRHRDLFDYLSRHGIQHGGRLLSAAHGLPHVALVRVTWPGRPARGHLILKSGRTWYDPLLARPHTGDLPSSREYHGGRVTSYCAITLSA